MSFIKDIFAKKKVNEKEINKPVKKKTAKRTMPDVNGKELYRIEKEKRKKEAEQKRIQEQKEQEAQRIIELEKLEKEKQQKKLEQEQKAQQATTKKVEKVNEEEVKEEREVIDAYGFEIIELKKGDVVEVELLAEERDKFIGQSLNNFQDVVIPKIEIENQEVNVGDTITVQIFKYYADEFYGSIRRYENKKNLEEQLNLISENETVKGKVISYKEPVFLVELENGLQGKVFIKNMDTNYISDVKPYLEKTYEFVIKEQLPKGRIHVELDRRSLLVKKQDELLSNISVDQVITVKEYEFNKGGIQFEYNGVRGFVPISEISHQFIRTIDDAKSLVDGEFDVKITQIEKQRGNLNLICSRKVLLQQPWEIFVANYQVGSEFSGKIVKKEQYGLFINIIDGVDGLLHNTKFSNDLATNIKDVNVGDEVYCYIETIDTDNQKVGLTCLKEETSIE